MVAFSKMRQHFDNKNMVKDLMYKKSNQIWLYASLYFLLLFKAGFYFQQNLSAITSTFFLVLLLFLYHRFHSKISSKAVLFILLTIFFHHVTYLVKGFPEIASYFLGVFNLVTVLLIVSIIRYNVFRRIFSNVIFAISMAALVCVILEKVGVPLYQYFPILTNSMGVSAYFLGITMVWTQAAYGMYHRAAGIFWEPGAFQAMIIFAMLIDLYSSEMTNKQLAKRYFVHSLTIFFTYSTTGYIGLILVLSVFFVCRTKYGKLSLLLYGLFAFFAISYLAVHSDGFLQYSAFGKLEEANAAYQTGESNTASSRIESVIYPLNEFIESPIVGMGVEGREALEIKLGHGMFTCTPINYFSRNGFFCGILHVIGFIGLLRLKGKKTIEKILIIIIPLIATSSEAFTFNPILESFLCYGFIRGFNSRAYLTRKKHI
jgi:hypothetical protein